ncbi:hypothetical protein niasHT_004828 [Heterodera trifolii]|uniref:Uncharacterized protein n=1 Tax=Heterodera trifolii TaxID=157864 RepID=A0ABD2MCX6_9BILA
MNDPGLGAKFTGSRRDPAKLGTMNAPLAFDLLSRPRPNLEQHSDARGLRENLSVGNSVEGAALEGRGAAAEEGTAHRPLQSNLTSFFFVFRPNDEMPQNNTVL